MRLSKKASHSLSQAYQQLALDNVSKQYTAHKGLFRLPYGILSAPGIFQCVMETLLRNIPGVIVYIDDIIVTGAMKTDHLKSLEEVLRWLAEARLHTKKHKVHIFKSLSVLLGAHH